MNAVVTVSYKDGRPAITLPTQELSERKTPRAKGVIKDLLAQIATVRCCGHTLRGKRLGPHAAAYAYDCHTCGWFGLGGHSDARGAFVENPRYVDIWPTPTPPERPADEPADTSPDVLANTTLTTTGESGSLAITPAATAGTAPETLKVDLCLWMPGEKAIGVGEADAGGGGDQQSTITLAALIIELLYRTGFDESKPEKEVFPGAALHAFRDTLGGLRINGYAASDVVLVVTSSDAAAEYSEYRLKCGSGLATFEASPVGVVIGEVMAIEEGANPRIWLHGLRFPITSSDHVVYNAKRSYERAYLRINEPRHSRVLFSASIALKSDSEMHAIGIGLQLVSDTYMPCDSHVEVQMANRLTELGIPHSKPRNAGNARQVPDHLVQGVAVEDVGRSDPRYIRSLLRKLARYVANGTKVVMWFVAFGEQLADAISKILQAIGLPLSTLVRDVRSLLRSRK